MGLSVIVVASVAKQSIFAATAWQRWIASQGLAMTLMNQGRCFMAQLMAAFENQIPSPKTIIGKWRLIGMETWENDYIDMIGPGYIQFESDHGVMEFGVVNLGLTCEYSETTAWFTFEGSDEMDQVSGEGDAEVEEDGTLSGEIRFRDGDETTFTARRWCHSDVVRNVGYGVK